MTRGRHDLRWTVVAGYEGSASSEDALALARRFLGAAGGRLVAGAVRPAAIALAEDGVVRVYSTAGVLPEDDVQEVLAPLPGGVPVQAAAPVRVLTAGSGKILDVVIAGAAGRFGLPGFGRRQAGRWIRACRCPVLVLPGSQTAAGGRAPVADREEAA